VVGEDRPVRGVDIKPTQVSTREHPGIPRPLAKMDESTSFMIANLGERCFNEIAVIVRHPDCDTLL